MVPPSHGVSRVVNHKDFYLRGGDMTVIVENHQYRIHSYFFDRESLFFRQKFGDPSDTEGRRSTDKDAFTLENVKSEDFERFLWVFYNPKYSIYEAPLETWLSILKLANQWTFDSVKELCVRELEKIEIEPVEKISTYHNNTISRLYLIPSYIAVCKRDAPLTFKEGMSLGMETVLRIAEAREKLRQQASESGIRTPTFEDFEDAEVEVLIREIFHLGSRPTPPSQVTSPVNGATGSANGIIKLSPAPAGNPPKANGAPAPRANGGSAADPKGSSVDSMPSITSVMAPKVPSTEAATPTAEPTGTQTTPAQTTTTPQHEQRVQVPPVQTAQTLSSSPLLPSDKPKDNKETASPAEPNSATSKLFSNSKSGGAGGEPSSSGEATGAGVGSNDNSITKPVVPSSDNENLTGDSNDNVNEADKDESGKDADTMSVISDAEGGKGRQGGSKGRKAKPGRGAKKP